MTSEKIENLEASFLTLAMSVASSAAMSMGLTSEQEAKNKTDLKMARFNIDLLDILKEKTKNNLTREESDFMTHVLADLKIKFVEVSNREKTAHT